MKNNKRIAARLPLSVEISGRGEVLISGCTGILRFSEDEIGVRTESSPVAVRGAKLTLCWAGEGRLMIKGRVDAVQFEGEK